MFGLIGGFLSLVGGWIGGIFKKDAANADLIGKATEALKDINVSAAQREDALARVITAESNSGGITALWRPLFMCIFLVIIVSFWFGYVPPQLNTPMPPMIARLFDLIELGIAGYIPARTIEKIVQQVNLGSVLKTLINKYVPTDTK